MKQHEFREQFRTESIFKISVEEPYKLIDKVSTTVREMHFPIYKVSKKVILKCLKMCAVKSSSGGDGGRDAEAAGHS